MLFNRGANTCVSVSMFLVAIASNVCWISATIKVSTGDARFNNLKRSHLLSDKLNFTHLANANSLYSTTNRHKRKAAESSLLWPNATVPYTFGLPETDNASIIQAIEHWEVNTCLRFVEVSNSSEAHIIFRKLDGCRSSVGRKEAPGQNVSIGDTCNKMGIIVHEIGHALGFYHEIRRPDRDDHVFINDQNIEMQELFNFYKLHGLDHSIPYDLSSVMHYSSMEWSKNGRTTVATKDPMLQGIIGLWKGGYSMGLSHRDKRLANDVYKCIHKWMKSCNMTKDPCVGEGYLGHDCKCVCPPGTSGIYCEKKIGSYYDDLKSPCSQEVTYETTIKSPHYPQNYDSDSWCIFRVNAGQCRVPVLTILDFQMGPRDSKDQCFYDFLEIRNDSLYNGVMKCGSEVTPGDTFRSKESTMILFFKGEEGGYRGFKAMVTFDFQKGCCKTLTNGTNFHILSPHYPSRISETFKCSIDLIPKVPAKVRILSMKYTNKENPYTFDETFSIPLPCELLLCQPNSLCESRCKTEKEEQLHEITLPNSGSIHFLTSFSRTHKRPIHLVFQMESSPCHAVIEITSKNPMGQLLAGPLKNKDVQCEWWIKAPRGNHVKLLIERLKMNESRDSYLVFNEVGDASYPDDTSRIFRLIEQVPKYIVSINTTLNLVVQGDSFTQVLFTYELYSCFDQHEDCQYWSSIGECDANSEWMLQNCKYSCNQCDFSTQCVDFHEECNFWKNSSQCVDNKEWMSLQCPKACGHCEFCVDRNPSCGEWKLLGHCKISSKYMESFCKKTCQFCDESKSTKIEELNEVKNTSGIRNETLNEILMKDSSPIPKIGIASTTATGPLQRHHKMRKNYMKRQNNSRTLISRIGKKLSPKTKYVENNPLLGRTGNWKRQKHKSNFGIEFKGTGFPKPLNSVGKRENNNKSVSNNLISKIRTKQSLNSSHRNVRNLNASCKLFFKKKMFFKKHLSNNSFEFKQKTSKMLNKCMFAQNANKTSHLVANNNTTINALHSISKRTGTIKKMKLTNKYGGNTPSTNNNLRPPRWNRNSFRIKAKLKHPMLGISNLYGNATDPNLSSFSKRKYNTVRAKITNKHNSAKYKNKKFNKPVNWRESQKTNTKRNKMGSSWRNKEFNSVKNNERSGNDWKKNKEENEVHNRSDFRRKRLPKTTTFPFQNGYKVTQKIKSKKKLGKYLRPNRKTNYLKENKKYAKNNKLNWKNTGNKTFKNRLITFREANNFGEHKNIANKKFGAVREHESIAKIKSSNNRKHQTSANKISKTFGENENFGNRKSSNFGKYQKIANRNSNSFGEHENVDNWKSSSFREYKGIANRKSSNFNNKSTTFVEHENILNKKFIILGERETIPTSKSRALEGPKTLFSTKNIKKNTLKENNSDQNFVERYLPKFQNSVNLTVRERKRRFKGKESVTRNRKGGIYRTFIGKKKKKSY